MNRFGKKDGQPSDVQYEGNVLARMLSYMKPHWKTMAFCLMLVLAVTALELYKPVLIGDAIDLYITGDYATGEMAQERFRGVLLAAAGYVGVLL